MQQLTGSISRGKTAEKHNTRENYNDNNRPDNIDKDRTESNVILVNKSIEDVYHERFDEALAEYNESQIKKRHPERIITNYLDKVKNDKQLQPMYEFVIQVGNKDEHADVEISTQIYSEFLSDFISKYNSNFAVKQAIIHLDEATPHLHLEVVPVAESKRGLRVQNSLNKAIAQAGFQDFNTMLAGWDELLTDVMANHDIMRVAGDKERQCGGVDMHTYKRMKREQEKADFLEQESAALEQEIAAETQRLESLRRENDEREAEVEELERETDEREAEVEELEEIISLAERLSKNSGELKRAEEEIQQLRTVEQRIGQIRIRLANIAKIISNAFRELIEQIRDDIRSPFNDLGDLKRVSGFIERNHKTNERNNGENIRR